MKKILLALTVLCGTAWSSYAQTSTTNATTNTFSIGIKPKNGPADAGHFSFGLDGGVTFAGIRPYSHTILGASAKYELPFATNTLFTVSAGYAYMVYTDKHRKDIDNFDGVDQKGGSFIPVKVGVKHYFDNHFFVEGQVGAAISLESNNPHNRHNTAFIYSGGIGYTLSNGLEAGVRYEDWAKNGDISQVALRLAYRFK
jgi:hypothetical protein